MIPETTRKMLAEFRLSRNQTSQASKPEPKPPTRNRPTPNTPYEAFLRKYSDLENTIDKLGTRDLVYYFREISQECGFKYVISNIKKDMAIMKRLKANYSNREICGMIEFLYESDQDYLDKNRLSPNLLASSWVNTIYADMQLWVEDKYIPRSVQTKSKKNIKQREWDKTEADTDNDVSIGVKL